MRLMSTIELAALALLAEAAIGYPAFIYRAIGHPVTWMGGLLAWLDRRLNREAQSFARRRFAGIAALLVLLSVTAGIAWALERLTAFRWLGLALQVLMASSLIAQRSLYDHVRAVADALETDGLVAGRKAVSMIVGRNPDRLDEAGVARAAIESLAENFADGIVAPVFWMALGGLPGAALYKAANTADSMIGHLNARYAAFGWAAARFDDLVNLPASRLAALFLGLASGSPGSAWRAVWRDAPKHRSPNAGWPEAAMAGALGLKLAGPRVYGEETVDDAFMGDGRRLATAADIRRALRVYVGACVLEWVVLVFLCALVA
jgi:adenosylcobinamide-phosphate synthase